jgi:Ca2+-binding EF-hand superfamily protein
MNNMFNPKTEKIEKLSKIHPEVIKELVKILDRSTNIYLDYGNLHHWSKKLGWHIDQKRLKQFFDSLKQ